MKAPGSGFDERALALTHQLEAMARQVDVRVAESEAATEATVQRLRATVIGLSVFLALTLLLGGIWLYPPGVRHAGWRAGPRRAPGPAYCPGRSESQDRSRRCARQSAGALSDMRSQLCHVTQHIQTLAVQLDDGAQALASTSCPWNKAPKTQSDVNPRHGRSHGRNPAQHHPIGRAKGRSATRPTRLAIWWLPVKHWCTPAPIA